MRNSISEIYSRKNVASVYIYEEDKFEHNYDIIVDTAEEETQIVYSQNPIWTEEFRGKKTGSVNDDGNNVTIKIDNKKITLDYCQMEVLTALILACNQTRMELRQHKVISSISSLNETL